MRQNLNLNFLLSVVFFLSLGGMSPSQVYAEETKTSEYQAYKKRFDEINKPHYDPEGRLVLNSFEVTREEIDTLVMLAENVKETPKGAPTPFTEIFYLLDFSKNPKENLAYAFKKVIDLSKPDITIWALNGIGGTNNIPETLVGEVWQRIKDLRADLSVDTERLFAFPFSTAVNIPPEILEDMWDWGKKHHAFEPSFWRQVWALVTFNAKEYARQGHNRYIATNVLDSVAAQPQVSEALMSKIMAYAETLDHPGDYDHHIFHSLASNPKTPQDYLMKLYIKAKDGRNARFLFHFAKNPNAPPAMLEGVFSETLALDKDALQRYHYKDFLNNPNTPEDVLAKIRADMADE